MRWYVAAVGSMMLCGSAAWGGEVPLYKPAPDWVKPAPPITAAQLAPSASFLVLMDSQQRIQDGEVWSYIDTATRMASPEMLQQAGTLTLPWQPDKGDLIVHRLEILRGGERIDLLAGGHKLAVIRREQKLEQRELNGELTATMPVEGLRVGDVLRATISITGRDAALRGGAQTAAMLPAAPTRVGYFRSRMVWPAKDGVRWKAYTDAAAPTVATLPGGWREVVVEGALPKPAELPADLPVRLQRPALLEASSFSDWPSVSRTMAPLYATTGLIAPGSPLAGEIARIKAAHAKPIDRAAAALALVQDQVRYLYNGMAGGNYTPQTPADTWSLRYGDCKAKTLLLLAMLHALDIEAEPVIAPAEAGDLIEGRLPSPGAFDHVLVRATVGGETLWLDGTGGGTRLADIRDLPSFRTVLPLRTAGAEPLAVPFRAPARPEGGFTIEFDQRAGLTLPTLVTVKGELRGQAAAAFGIAATQASDEQKRQFAQEVVEKLIGEVRLTGQSFTYDEATGIGTLSATGLMTTPWRTERGRRRLVIDRAVGDIGFAPDRARAAWRGLPVALGGPSRARYQVRVLLPEGSRGYTLAGDETIAEPIAGRQIMRKASLAEGVAQVEDDIALVAAELPADQVTAARARLAVAEGRKLEVVAPVAYPSHPAEVTAARKAGLIRPLLAAYDKAVANDPEDAEVYLGRARFQAGIYDYKAAIPDLDRALAIAPDADTLVWRANLHRISGDAKKRAADLEEALRVDPASYAAIDASATYRRETGDVKGAVALLDEQIAAGGQRASGFRRLKSELLADTGDVRGGIALLDALVESEPEDAGMFNARCWMRATHNVDLETALGDCNKALQLSKGASNVLDSRALVYHRLGRNEDALKDLAAALEKAPGQSGSLYLRAVVLGGQGKAADAKSELATARLIDPLIDQEYGRWGLKP